MSQGLTPQRWQQVEAIFEAALELPVAARAGFLDTECGGDPELRRQVEALLAQDAAAGTFLENPAMLYAETWGDPPVPRPREVFADEARREEHGLPIGQRLGAYRLEEEIGRGGGLPALGPMRTGR